MSTEKKGRAAELMEFLNREFPETQGDPKLQKILRTLSLELDIMHRCLEWYSGHLRPEDRVNDNGDKAEKTLKSIGYLETTYTLKVGPPPPWPEGIMTDLQKERKSRGLCVVLTCTNMAVPYTSFCKECGDSGPNAIQLIHGREIADRDFAEEQSHARQPEQ